MGLVEQALPSKRKAPWHLMHLVRILERETDSYASKQLGDHTPFLLVKQLLDKYAKLDEVHIDKVFDEWAFASWALRDAVDELKIQMFDKPAPVEAGIVGWCDRCWRSGERSRKGLYYCALHPPGSSAHRQALRLDVWRHPDQDPAMGMSFEWQQLKRLTGTVPSGLRRRDPTDDVIERLQRGDARALDELNDHRVDLSSLWPYFPHVLALLRPIVRNASVLLDVAAVYPLLDPPITRGGAEQELIYQAMRRDQRLFHERLQYAEAWLCADQARRSHWGGPRPAARRKRHVVGLRPSGKNA